MSNILCQIFILTNDNILVPSYRIMIFLTRKMHISCMSLPSYSGWQDHESAQDVNGWSRSSQRVYR